MLENTSPKIFKGHYHNDVKGSDINSGVTDLTGTDVSLIFISAIVVLTLAGASIGALCKSVRMANVTATICLVACSVGISAYPLWCMFPDMSCIFPIPSALGQYAIMIDQVSALMITLSSVVFFLTVVHVVISTSDSGCRYCSLLNALYLSVILCMVADSSILLLMSWELITLTTFLLGKGKKNESERWLFFVVAHIGGMLLICAYSYMSMVAGTVIMSQWTGMSAVMGTWTASVTMALVFLGFGAKLGLVPFHVWMPGFYGTAPTHTASLLSTVCSNVAVLAMFKTIFGYMGVSEGMVPLAVIILALASVTALWGSLESLIQSEPKRTLAYSGMENMALVVLCISLATIYFPGSPALAKLSLIAALLHTINHSVFKSLMLMVIDTVEDSTGETRIERLGGLAKTMHAFALIATIGVLAIAAIPPTNGFVSEWLMILSLMGADLASIGVSLVVPLALAVVGICGMMMAASYARLYGFIFLGRPRSDGAANPRPMKKGNMMPMAILAVLCVCLGVASFPVMDALSSGIISVTGLPASPGYETVMSSNAVPLLLGISIVMILVIVGVLFSYGQKDRRSVPTWGCGGTLGQDMQYSSAGFTQPIIRVFHPIYGDMTEVVDCGGGRKKTYHTAFVEPFEKYLYRPLGKLVSYMAEKIGKMQTGNIQSYFAYILIALLVMLLAVRLI